MNAKHSHLTSDDRIRIETFIAEGRSVRYIADRLDKAPSTISRELKKHVRIIIPAPCDCLSSSSCSLRHVCGAQGCHKKCKDCHKAKKYCSLYIKRFCDRLEDMTLKFCNSCSKRSYCHLERRFYDGRAAHKEYLDTLVHSRDGFDLTAKQLMDIDQLVSPLVKRGQSVYHIVQAHHEQLPVSESTIRRLIKASEMDAIVLDLPEAVKRKLRHKRPSSPSSPPASKTGHLYPDFLAHTAALDLPVIQMDCVEGKASDPEALLTLHFVSFHMQLVFILPRHDSASVVALFDTLEETLGQQLFSQCFPLILTDNGHEFSDIDGIERSLYGGRRTRLFFCEPNRSDQKGQCENNHKLIRRIIPKGTSISRFMQSDMLLLTQHINSLSADPCLADAPLILRWQLFPMSSFSFWALKSCLRKKCS